ncbi:hypothetical protein ACH5RR_039570 [Cinchona calisaya]|uniref:Leucine-rich repeat-containing N-terminal plant-type domain-containing protein n=1 Tax=Cinchona calisaya TaxID=153742 RepID=A0ABD2Y3P3_9GENT
MALEVIGSECDLGFVERFQIPLVGVWSSSANVLRLVLLVMNLPQNISAARFVGNETDRMALLEFKNQISGDPNEVLNSWNHSHHHCQWHGITCDARHRSKGHSLKFASEIPQEVGRLIRLRFHNMSRNTLTGEIPVNKLEKLYLATNNLTGEIPSTIGNQSSIKELSFSSNNLEGNLPEEISLLTSLMILEMGSNKLTGHIPPSRYNISTLTLFAAPENLFYGSLPPNLGLKLTNLQIIAIAGNIFYGEVPIQLPIALSLK